MYKGTVILDILEMFKDVDEEKLREYVHTLFSFRIGENGKVSLNSIDTYPVRSSSKVTEAFGKLINISHISVVVSVVLNKETKRYIIDNIYLYHGMEQQKENILNTIYGFLYERTLEGAKENE